MLTYDAALLLSRRKSCQSRVAALFKVRVHGLFRGIRQSGTAAMTKLISATTLLIFLASCGAVRDSRLNPANWFGRSKEEKTVQIATVIAPGDTKGMVDRIVSLKVDRVPGGAIVRAVGLPTTQGNWQAELRPLNDEKPDKGTLVYEFHLSAPTSQQATGTKQSREVLVGRFISTQTLIGVSRIEVRGQRNKHTVRR